jgi:hypothetical protein
MKNTNAFNIPAGPSTTVIPRGLTEGDAIADRNSQRKDMVDAHQSYEIELFKYHGYSVYAEERRSSTSAARTYQVFHRHFYSETGGRLAERKMIDSIHPRATVRRRNVAGICYDLISCQRNGFECEVKWLFKR